jgi:peptide/nickel transport system substrate-binding protein
MYDSLLRYQKNPPEIVPWLAEHTDVADGGRTWTFRLRRGVQFHDGSEVDAEAVRFSFERLLAIGKGLAGVFKRMGLNGDKVRAVGSHTVEIKLDRPYGAFRLVKADSSSGLTMERFPEFWRGWREKYVDEVEIRVIREQSSQILALMKGDVHIVQGNLPADQIERLEKHPRITVTPQESMRILLIRMHNQREPFTDINVRKAFNHAFNYDSFIKDILKNRVVRNPGPTPRPLWGYPEDVAGYDYDPDKAKAYLAKAQVKITRPLDLHVQMTAEQSLQAGLLFQSDLAKLGIEVRLVKALFPALTASTKTQETTPDMWIHWVSTYYVDPENWIGEMYDSSNWGAWKASSWYQNPEVDALLDQARRLVDQDQRAKLYEEAYRLVVADAADIWIYNTLEHVPLAKVVQGFQFSPVGSGQEFWPISLSAKG